MNTLVGESNNAKQHHTCILQQEEKYPLKSSFSLIPFLVFGDADMPPNYSQPLPSSPSHPPLHPLPVCTPRQSSARQRGYSTGKGHLRKTSPALSLRLKRSSVFPTASFIRGPKTRPVPNLRIQSMHWTLCPPSIITDDGLLFRRKTTQWYSVV